MLTLLLFLFCGPSRSDRNRRQGHREQHIDDRENMRHHIALLTDEDTTAKRIAKKGERLRLLLERRIPLSVNDLLPRRRDGEGIKGIDQRTRFFPIDEQNRSAQLVPAVLHGRLFRLNLVYRQQSNRDTRGDRLEPLPEGHV